MIGVLWQCPTLHKQPEVVAVVLIAWFGRTSGGCRLYCDCPHCLTVVRNILIEVMCPNVKQIDNLNCLNKISFHNEFSYYNNVTCLENLTSFLGIVFVKNSFNHSFMFLLTLPIFVLIIPFHCPLTYPQPLQRISNRLSSPPHRQLCASAPL